MPKPLIADKPYPTTEDLCPDAYSLRIISPAYASSTGELNNILQYNYHSINFSAGRREEHAQIIDSIAIAEMIHFRLLGKTISALGAQPLYTAQPPSAFNFYSAKFVGYSRTLRNMIEDDVMSEKYSIAAYERMLCRLRNEKVKAVVSRILEDERLHLAAFTTILREMQ